ncbi:MAG: hypothetical protein Q8882_09135, partial [Bacillota bacterium]|nr:hypothetical protein [Bacillota bacterium]
LKKIAAKQIIIVIISINHSGNTNKTTPNKEIAPSNSKEKILNNMQMNKHIRKISSLFKNFRFIIITT